MGMVYKARDSHLDRFMAIKIMPPERVADPERKRRFIQEAQSASALNHPNIITVHDITQEGGMNLMVMEYVPGQDAGRVDPNKHTAHERRRASPDDCDNAREGCSCAPTCNKGFVSTSPTSGTAV